MYRWLREPAKPGRARKQARTTTRYLFEVKLRAVERFQRRLESGRHRGGV